jgi:heme oxygenase
VPILNTKHLRRAYIKSLIQQLIWVRDAEETYKDNIPLNLQGSVVFETAEQCVLSLDEAIEILSAAY